MFGTACCAHVRRRAAHGLLSVCRGIVLAWAGLCLAGIAATSALDAEPYADEPESPAGEPTPTATYTVDCREIADDIERDRAGAERRMREGLKGGHVTVRDVAVPEECAGVLEARGLKRD